MSQNLLSAAVVIGALRVKSLNLVQGRACSGSLVANSWDQGKAQPELDFNGYKQTTLEAGKELICSFLKNKFNS